VKEPRHFIVFRRHDGVIEILRVLHDRRNLAQLCRRSNSRPRIANADNPVLRQKRRIATKCEEMSGKERTVDSSTRGCARPHAFHHNYGIVLGSIVLRQK
jgi:hypothetical protein